MHYVVENGRKILCGSKNYAMNNISVFLFSFYNLDFFTQLHSNNMNNQEFGLLEYGFLLQKKNNLRKTKPKVQQSMKK